MTECFLPGFCWWWCCGFSLGWGWWCWCFLQHTKGLVAKCWIRSRPHQRVNFFISSKFTEEKKKSTASLLAALRFWETALCSGPSRVAFMRAEWACSPISSFATLTWQRCERQGPCAFTRERVNGRDSAPWSCPSELAIARAAAGARWDRDGPLVTMAVIPSGRLSQSLSSLPPCTKPSPCFFGRDDELSQRSEGWAKARSQRWECAARRGKGNTQHPRPWQQQQLWDHLGPGCTFSKMKT